VAAVRATYGRPVIKALGVRQGADLDAAAAYEDAADHLMLDAKPPEDADRPGGHGGAFDWSLLAGRTFRRPWFLAGGLTAENVAEAIAATGAPGVDVSSGVERAPGVKDPALIAAFIRAAREA
jgi:phosphoribosylanthranilate isomerase